MEWTSWRQLRYGGAELVLCVDFAGGRAEAGFADLATHLPLDATVLLARPVDTGQDVVPAGVAPAWIARWTDEVLATGRPVIAVLGFCAGASLAVAIADGLPGPRPPVLLFEADVATAESLDAQFVHAVESSAEHLTADEVADARAWSAALLARHGTDLVPIARGMVDRYRVLMSRLAERLGLDGFFRDELVAGFARYMSYLIVAAERAYGSPGEGLTLISSRDHEPPVAGLPLIRFDVPRNDLLGNGDVAMTVAGLIDRVDRVSPVG